MNIKERYALSSSIELYIIYTAEYMKKYAAWYNHGPEDMINFIMKKSRGHMDPHVLRDKVNELYRSVGAIE